jgi:hypothetical protein
MNVLEMSAYFQGKRMVDDYLDQFQDLVYDSRYTDPKTIMVKFHRGLDWWISATLAGMASGQPSDTDPEAWFNLAVQMDQNHAADKAFQASHHTTSTPTPAARSYASVPRPPLPAHFAHSSPSPGNPIPMDIDAAQKGKTPGDACRHYGNTGHWAKDCHLQFNVHYMDADEVEMALEDKLAAKDAVLVEP